MKFQVGDIVKVRETGRIAEIKAYKLEGFYHGGKIVDTIKYYIHIKPHTNAWMDEKDLTYHEYEFSSKFELNLLNLLIDINLDHKNFEMVKQLNDLKQKYIKK